MDCYSTTGIYQDSGRGGGARDELQAESEVREKFKNMKHKRHPWIDYLSLAYSASVEYYFASLVVLNVHS
jgi:hypothetical protein